MVCHIVVVQYNRVGNSAQLEFARPLKCGFCSDLQHIAVFDNLQHMCLCHPGWVLFSVPPQYIELTIPLPAIPPPLPPPVQQRRGHSGVVPSRPPRLRGL